MGSSVRLIMIILRTYLSLVIRRRMMNCQLVQLDNRTSRELVSAIICCMTETARHRQFLIFFHALRSVGVVSGVPRRTLIG